MPEATPPKRRGRCRKRGSRNVRKDIRKGKRSSSTAKGKLLSRSWKNATSPYPGEAERLKKLYEESGATDLRTFKEKVPTETDGTKLYVFYEAVICKKLL